MKIYTKTGDKGQTGVIGGRVNKDSIIIETIGAFDELNANIGLAVSLNALDKKSNNKLTQTQNIIFCIGSILSGAQIDCDFALYTKQLEKDIDLMTATLAELKNFILPGGTQIAAQIHVCRTACRRAERQLLKYSVEYIKEKPLQMSVEKSDLDLAQKYINRLSDYFFTLARFVNHLNNVEDVYWNKLID